MELRQISASLRTGDLILIAEGESLVCKLIKLITRSRWSHVAMILRPSPTGPPLVWHAVLTQKLQDVFFHRDQSGAQVDPLEEVWKYVESKGHLIGGVRRLAAPLTPAQEQATFEFIRQNYGTAFPSTGDMFREWAEGHLDIKTRSKTYFCAELAAATYMAAGLLPEKPPANAYSPQTFATEKVHMLEGAQLGDLELVEPPPHPVVAPATSA